MTRTDLHEYQRRLLLLRERIGSSVQSLRGSLSDEPDAEGGLPDTMTDTADRGSHEYEDQVDFALAGTEEKILGEIDAALARVEAGSFGSCSSCQRPIESERLRTLPYVRDCKRCAARGESTRS